MNVEIVTEASQFLFLEYNNGFFIAVRLLQVYKNMLIDY